MPVRATLMMVALGLLATAGIAEGPSGSADGAPLRAKEVRFKSGKATIVASLLRPPGEGPFPGVVIVHGSGNSSRSNPWTTAYAEALVARGIAVLHPDKRGSGESSGNWRTANFLVLADDAIAGVECLRAEPKVDVENIGVIGFSQGGHIVPAAAARSNHIAFAVSVSGSTVPILEQIGDEIALMAERAGVAAEDAAALRTIHESGVRYALSSDGWDEYAKALATAKTGNMRGMDVIESFPTEPDAPAWEFLRTIGNYDPMDYWTQLDIPVAFVYGGRDTQIRIQKSVRRVFDVLDPKEINYTLLVFRLNGHALYRDDALDFLTQWIRNRGKT